MYAHSTMTDFTYCKDSTSRPIYLYFDLSHKPKSAFLYLTNRPNIVSHTIGGDVLITQPPIDRGTGYCFRAIPLFVLFVSLLARL